MKPPSLTIGIEEEYQIIDPQTRELRSYITQILEERPDAAAAEQIKPELHQSMVESRIPRMPDASRTASGTDSPAAFDYGTGCKKRA